MGIKSKKNGGAGLDTIAKIGSKSSSQRVPEKTKGVKIHKSAMERAVDPNLTEEERQQARDELKDCSSFGRTRTPSSRGREIY